MGEFIHFSDPLDGDRATPVKRGKNLHSQIIYQASSPSQIHADLLPSEIKNKLKALVINSRNPQKFLGHFRSRVASILSGDSPGVHAPSPLTHQSNYQITPSSSCHECRAHARTFPLYTRFQSTLHSSGPVGGGGISTFTPPIKVQPTNPGNEASLATIKKTEERADSLQSILPLVPGTPIADDKLTDRHPLAILGNKGGTVYNEEDELQFNWHAHEEEEGCADFPTPAQPRCAAADNFWVDNQGLDIPEPVGLRDGFQEVEKLGIDVVDQQSATHVQDLQLEIDKEVLVCSK